MAGRRKGATTGNDLPTLGPRTSGSAKAVSRTTTSGTAIVRRAANSAEYLRGLAMETFDPAARFDGLTYEQAVRTVLVAVRRDTAGLSSSERTSSYAPGKMEPISSSGGAGNYSGPPFATSVRLFIEGDHWQGGYGWMGPLPGPNEPSHDIALSELARGFVSRNVLAEMVARHAAGCVGHEPHWQVVPRRVMTDDEQPNPLEKAMISEATEFLTAWWNQRKVFEFMQESVIRLAYQGRSAIRIFVPRGLLEPVTIEGSPDPALAVVIPPGGGIPAALAMLWPDDPLKESARLAEDPDTRRHVGITLYELGCTIDGQGEGMPFAELTYKGPDDTTILRTMGRDNVGARTVMDLGGRLTLFEMERRTLVTPQLVQMQKALNLALSVLPRTLVSAAFLERVILNAQLPGEWETDSSTGAKLRFKPDAMKYGAGMTTVLQGIEVEDEATGKTTTMSPDMKWREPSSLDPAVSAVRELYENMLEEGNQAHVLMNKDAVASGVSREVARREFQNDIGLTVARVQDCGAWLLETALAMAEMFCGVPGQYTDTLKLVFTCRVDSGAVDAADKKNNMEMAEAGYMARETAMALNNIQDVDAEMALIAGEPGGMLARLARQAAVLHELSGAGSDIYGGAIVAGFTKDEAELLSGTSDAEPQVWSAAGAIAPLPSDTEDADAPKTAAPTPAKQSGSKQQRPPTGDMKNRGIKQ